MEQKKTTQNAKDNGEISDPRDEVFKTEQSQNFLAEKAKVVRKNFLRDKKDILIKGDFYVFNREVSNNAHAKSIFEKEVLPGVFATFAEPKSKFKSGRFRLIELKINSELYTLNEAHEFWSRFHVKYINFQLENKKLPLIYKIVGRVNKSHKGYIVICEPANPTRENIQNQKKFEFWLEKFYANETFSNDEETLSKAIPALLERFKINTNLLQEIPTKENEGWRIFEEIVAEIFQKFGYKVILTKKTNDGGRDIIALINEGDERKRILIECKHWKHNKVGIDVIKTLIGTAMTEKETPTGIILATSNFFSFTEEDSKIYYPGVKLELELKDYNDILEWINQYNAINMQEKDIDNYLEFLRIK